MSVQEYAELLFRNNLCLALNLTNESENVAIETCMRWYIAKSFEKASQEYNPKAASRANESKDYYGKANFLFHTTPPLKMYNNQLFSITVLLVFCQY